MCGERARALEREREVESETDRERQRQTERVILCAREKEWDRNKGTRKENSQEKTVSV